MINKMEIRPTIREEMQFGYLKIASFFYQLCTLLVSLFLLGISLICKDMMTAQGMNSIIYPVMIYLLIACVGLRLNLSILDVCYSVGIFGSRFKHSLNDDDIKVFKNTKMISEYACLISLTISFVLFFSILVKIL